MAYRRNAVHACDHGVLADTSEKASHQLIPRKEYDKKPWIDDEERHLQVFEAMHPVLDFTSFTFALVCGGIACRLGGFWFYVGSILGFILFRKAVIYFKTKFPSQPDRPKDVLSPGYNVNVE